MRACACVRDKTGVDLLEESVEPLSALVVLRVHPDDAHGVEQLWQQGGDGLGRRRGELLAGRAEKGDELEAALGLCVTLLRGWEREGEKGVRE